MKIKRGQVYLADLKDALGSEQGGIRPVLVVQNNRGNKYSPTIIIACITSKAHTLLYTRIYRIKISFNYNDGTNKSH